MFTVSALYSEIGPLIPNWVIVCSALMLILALVFTLIRFYIGPRTPDRIVALDLVAGLTLAALLLSGIASGSEFYLQSVLGFSLVLFLGTVAMARYLDRSDGNDRHE
jgi:multisubunit Na+/H+ antiporter MnhF subunit